MLALILQNSNHMARRGDSNSAPGCGCFVAIAIIGIVIYLVMKSRQDRQVAQQPAPMAPRATGEGPIGSHTFACPFPKCPNCAASAEKMKQQWDGLRKVTWTCGYCGAVQVQELRDDELPPVARQRMGLDPMMDPNQPSYPQQSSGGMGGVGGLLTGMMIGNMMGGNRHHHDDDHWGSGGSSSDGGWGDSGGGDSGGDGGWGDSGGDDFGGGDSGGDSGDWS